MPSNFIPTKRNQIVQMNNRLAKKDGQRRERNLMTVALQALRMKLKKQHGVSGERFTCKWNFDVNEFTISIFFKDGSHKKDVEDIKGDEEGLAKMLYAMIKTELKDCKQISIQLMECNFNSLSITKNEVYFYNSKDEQDKYPK